jgi:hypothetical protein
LELISQLCDEPSYCSVNYCFSFDYSGKRRALIPPEVGYITENLKPIPDEVTL